jgi:hypothetical protein
MLFDQLVSLDLRGNKFPDVLEGERRAWRRYD